MKKIEYVVVFVTIPNDKTKDFVNFILENKLAACVNIVKNINSYYWWEAKICNDKESLLIIKTTKKLSNKLVDEIKKIHPYKVAEIIFLPIIAGNKEYLNWIKNSLRK